MAIRILALLTVCVLSGCVSNGVNLPKGVYWNKCSTHATVDPSRPASCMTLAEYRTARKQVRHSQEQATREAEGVEEVEAVDARSRIGIP